MVRQGDHICIVQGGSETRGTGGRGGGVEEWGDDDTGAASFLERGLSRQADALASARIGAVVPRAQRAV